MHKEPYCFVAEPFIDDRGTFANVFRLDQAPYNLFWSGRTVSQVNICSNKAKGTIRGLHFQGYPHADAKIIRCIAGHIWDVIVDLREEASTYGIWYSYDLSSSNNQALFVPEGFAHGYQVLQENSQIMYIHSAPWEPSAERGVRYNDPLLSISWPLTPTLVSKRDQSLPLLRSAA